MRLATSPRFVVAAPHSGSGKTTVTALLCLLLRSQGKRVQPFKVGPDYLDPTHLSRAAGQEARTLDSFLLPPTKLQSLFARAAAQADIAVIEGVMGLYDGRDPTSSEHSSAHIARLLQAPVVLVIDAGGMARTVAAIAQGLRDFGKHEESENAAAPPLHIAGIILNRVGSERHAQLCAAALQQSGIPCFGFVLRDEALHLPSRHLGLLSAEQAHWDEKAAMHAARHLDLNALLDAVCAAPALPILPAPAAQAALNTHKKTSTCCRIAYAHDEAFHFYYPDSLDELRAQGAELIAFSPLHDRQLPDADGLLLGGGYPEAHASALSANRAMLAAVQGFAGSGRPVVAECGGLMYLSRTLEDLEGYVHNLCGVVPYHTRMSAKVLLGYRDAQALSDSALMPAGTQVRGHEFHFSTLTHAPTHPAYRWAAPAFSGNSNTPQPPHTVTEGYAQGNIIASYLHLHYGGVPALAGRLVSSCVRARQR